MRARAGDAHGRSGGPTARSTSPRGRSRSALERSEDARVQARIVPPANVDAHGGYGEARSAAGDSDVSKWNTVSRLSVHRVHPRATNTGIRSHLWMRSIAGHPQRLAGNRLGRNHLRRRSRSFAARVPAVGTLTSHAPPSLLTRGRRKRSKPCFLVRSGSGVAPVFRTCQRRS